MNYYKRHIGDYLKDTAHLSLLEHGIYMRLLDVYYTREAGIPDGQAARLIGARGEDELAALQAVLGEYFRLHDGAWLQSRCEREIREASEKAARNREVGKLGGRPRKQPGLPDTLDGLGDDDGMACHDAAQAPLQTGLETQPQTQLQTETEPGANPSQQPLATSHTDTPAGRMPPCPYEAIRAAYNTALPQLPQSRELTATRKKHLQARWRDRWQAGKYASAAQGIAYWQRFFARVADTPFLRGDSPNGWRPDFAWFLLPDNFLKVVEGKFPTTAELEGRA
ncbi:Uncharacterized conserved protein YdaU, DUF1376 family [Andreprevotia lacus DSM 23236]|jgi:uncharacterized protein YdaU (DUF1376 family)|uniref:Uncharacterized conserved protein YdaU, DUF1376 family n=1 Tax=Andreprevotia lacus DSM 23236 TaxID=1121001 RepID=A0A1W1Y2B6_9NEIS|nr:YdaU family protein [Andreprevotia lacus]SMC29931.1 Uncharacterized conserved protein YdaU, DUF1376 family [Andreprevotia lacus DSM 23236]